MNDSSKNPTGVFWLVVLIVGFILFAQYAVATNPCNTKAYKRSLPSYSSSSTGKTYYTPKSTPKPSSTPKRSTSKSNSRALPASDYYHPEDFYDWYRDDFYDYEEAEDYYYSHGGK